jgi:excisionase family DNA binding protein
MITDTPVASFMCVADVADLLNVPRSTVHHWVAAKQAPPSFKIGKHRRFDRSEVMAWIETQKSGVARD